MEELTCETINHMKMTDLLAAYDKQHLASRFDLSPDCFNSGMIVLSICRCGATTQVGQNVPVEQPLYTCAITSNGCTWDELSEPGADIGRHG